jgi:hypothetical protein
MLDACFKCKRCRAAEYSLQEDALKGKWGKVESLPTEINDPAKVAKDAAEETVHEEADLPIHPAEETIPPKTTVHEEADLPIHPAEETVEEADLPIHPAEETITPKATCDVREDTTLDDTGVIPREVMALAVKDSVNKNPAEVAQDEIEQFQVQEPEETATLSPTVTVVKIIPKGIIIIKKTPHFEVIYINSKQHKFQLVGIINYL